MTGLHDRVVARTLVRLRGVPFEAGTVFVVRPQPDAAAREPVQVDAFTASRWLEEAWAAPVAVDGPAKPGSSRTK